MSNKNWFEQETDKTIAELTRQLRAETARANAYEKATNERRTSLTKYDQGWNDAMSFARQSVDEQTYE